MTKVRVIKPISFREEDIPMLKGFEKLAQTEGKDFSDLARVAMTEYLKAHGSGNPVYKLDQFQTGEFIALPTPWLDPSRDKLDGISPEEAKFMVGQMSKWYPELQRKAKTG